MQDPNRTGRSSRIRCPSIQQSQDSHGLRGSLHTEWREHRQDALTEFCAITRNSMNTLLINPVWNRKQGDHYAQWNQMLCLNRITPALPVTQLFQTHSYQCAPIPPGRTVLRVIRIRYTLTGSDKRCDLKETLSCDDHHSNAENASLWPKK
jgi:hypothetical protein